MTKKLSRFIQGILIASMFCVSGAAVAEELRVGLVTPPGQTWTVNAEQMAEEFNARSSDHTMLVFPSAQLGNEADMFQQLQTGSLSIAFMTVSEIANRVPEMNALLAPFLVESNAQAARFLAQGETAEVLLELLPERAGVIGLAYGMAGVTQVMTVDPVSGLEDLAGLKMRITPSPAIREWNRILGTSPTPLHLPALYDATVNGQIDALELNLEVMNLARYDDITSSLLVTHQSLFPMVVLVSEVVWDRMGAEGQMLLSELAKTYAGQILQQTVIAEQTALAALIERGGIEIVDIDPQVYADAITEWDAKWSVRAPAIADIRAEAAGFR